MGLQSLQTEFCGSIASSERILWIYRWFRQIFVCYNRFRQNVVDLQSVQTEFCGSTVSLDRILGDYSWFTQNIVGLHLLKTEFCESD